MSYRSTLNCAYYPPYYRRNDPFHEESKVPEDNILHIAVQNVSGIAAGDWSF
ncbi:MAG TPA: hypothetical protein VE130_06420 [Nitrososphaeraceae archaeon]|nr:hypothetical protein [Nitrososphaeraceae archaeon]